MRLYFQGRPLVTVARYGQGLTATGCGSCLRGSSGCQKHNIDQEQYHLLLLILERTFPPIPFHVVIFLFLAFEHCPGFVESRLHLHEIPWLPREISRGTAV